MSPYRTTPPAPVRAPRASWWRRLWHRGVSDRLAVSQLRRALLVRYPWATWRERDDLAEVQIAAVDSRGIDAVDLEFEEHWMVNAIEARDPRKVTATPRRPPPPPTVMPGPGRSVSE